MKLTKIIFILFAFITFGCEQKKTDPEVKEEITIERIVKSKKEHIETDYKYKFDPLNTIMSGDVKIRHQPSVSNVYYLMFTDGTYKRVEMDEYVIFDIGDSYIEKHYK